MSLCLAMENLINSCWILETNVIEASNQLFSGSGFHQAEAVPGNSHCSHFNWNCSKSTGGNHVSLLSPFLSKDWIIAELNNTNETPWFDVSSLWQNLSVKESFAPVTGKDTMTPHNLPHRIWPVGVPSGHSMLLVQSSSCRPGVTTSNRQAAEVMSRLREGWIRRYQPSWF